MRKSILFLAFIFCVSFASFAQTGIGARGIFGVDGNAYGGLEFSVQKIGHYEFDLGILDESWKATALKHFSFVKNSNIGVYGGGGIGIGYYDHFDELFGTFALNLGTYVMLGRLQLGLDWRPEWNFFNAPNRDLSFNLALSARWVFCQ
jgi:hypothetical protein